MWIHFGPIVYCGSILGSFSVMSLLYNPIPSLSFVNPKKDDKMERHELIFFCFVILLLNSALFLFGPILLTDPFIHSSVIIRFTDYGRPMKPFSSKSQTFGLGQTIWADTFWGIWGIFGQFINTHFVTVQWVPCPFFPLINHHFYKKLSLYIRIPNIYLGLGFEFGQQRIRDLAIVCP